MTPDFAAWVSRAAPHHVETDTGRRTKRDLVDALAHACAAAARAKGSSGTSGGAPFRGSDLVLSSLFRGADAGHASN